MKNAFQYPVVFLFGGNIYCLIEVIYMRHTHPSMLIAGGLSFLTLYFIETENLIKNRIIKYLAGGIIITIIEFVTGYIVNIVLKMNVWDYSHLPFNFMGQICLYFSLLWTVIAAGGYALSGLIYRRMIKASFSI